MQQLTSRPTASVALCCKQLGFDRVDLAVQHRVPCSHLEGFDRVIRCCRANMWQPIKHSKISGLCVAVADRVPATEPQSEAASEVVAADSVPATEPLPEAASEVVVPAEPVIIALGALVFVSTAVSGIDYVLIYARRAAAVSRGRATAAP